VRGNVKTASTHSAARCLDRYRRGSALLLVPTVLFFSSGAFAHGPAEGSKAPPGDGPAPTLVEPVPLMNRADPGGKPVTNFEFYVGERFGVWLQQVYEIGAITEGRNELKLAVVRAYEPGAATAHVTEATALRVDLSTESGRASRGWLDSQEVAQLAHALPSILPMRLTALAPASNRNSEVAFPRGRVVIGFRSAPGKMSDERLLIGVGDDGVVAFLKPERFPELQALVESANHTILEVQDRYGHHR